MYLILVLQEVDKLKAPTSGRTGELCRADTKSMLQSFCLIIYYLPLELVFYLKRNVIFVPDTWPCENLRHDATFFS